MRQRLHQTWFEAKLSVGRCLEVLHIPTARSIAASTFVARLPKAMVPIATVYFIHEVTGSYLLAGTVTAAIAIGDAATAPLQGRLVDRFGRATVLIPSSCLYAMSLVTLVLVAQAENPSTILMITCGVVVGAGFPPVSSAVKAVWVQVARDEAELAAAYTVESLVQQILFLLGPLAVTALLIAGSSATSLVTAAAMTVAGTIAFVRVTRAVPDRPASSTQGGRGALRLRLVRDLIATTWLQGLLFGILPVALPVLASTAGFPASGGWLLTALAIGGLLGTFGSISATSDLSTALLRYTQLVGRFAIPLLALAALGLLDGKVVLPIAALVLMAAGCFLTPIAASSYLIVGTATGAGQRNEAFAWMSTAQACGAAAGSALAGFVAEHSGVALTSVLPLVAVVLAALYARWRLVQN